MEAGQAPALSTRALNNPGSLYFPAILAAFVLISRILCRGTLYYADGPAMIRSIIAKTYIVEPPGYWLFDRIAGIFPNPVLAITVMNILFSAAGVVVFYYAACFFTNQVNAFLAALAYSTIFYIWFAGEVHSTYATQILFPVATFYLFLRYDRDRVKWALYLAAFTYAVGAGMRPSDGVFMIPMVLYFAAFRMPRKDALVLLSLITLLCLCWLLPTWVAFRERQTGVSGAASYVGGITTTKSILTGIDQYTLADVTRFVFALVFGSWPVLGVALLNMFRNWKDWRVKAMLLWIVPGSLFFVLLFIGTSTHLTFLTAAVLLLAVSAPRLMVVTALWNATMFLVLSPMPSQKLAVNIINSYAVTYTRKGIQMQYEPTLSELQHVDHKR
jgi:hypothetical protein